MIDIPDEEKEVVLRLLDNWYLQKIEKNYTKELEEELLCWLNEELQDRDEIRVLFEKYELDKIILSKEAQLQVAANYFSTIYKAPSLLELLFLSSNFSPAVKREYIDPLIERIKNIKEFINEVFIFAHKKGYNNLTHEDIDLVFRSVFGGIEGFVNLWMAFLDSALILLDLGRSIGADYPQELDKLLEIVEVLKPKLPFIISKIFGD
jgi:hypothetical protein